MKNRFAPTALALLAVPALVLSLAACSSGESSGGKTDGATSTKLTGFEWDLAHAKCMRAEGIEGYKDPVEGKPEAIGIDGDLGTFQKADETCRTKLTKELGERPVSDEEKKADEESLKQNERTNSCLSKLGYEVPEQNGQAMSTNGDIPASAYEKCGVKMGDAGQ